MQSPWPQKNKRQLRWLPTSFYPIFEGISAVGQKPTFRTASSYQQQMALVTEHEKPHYQQFRPDCTADNASYPQVPRSMKLIEGCAKQIDTST